MMSSASHKEYEKLLAEHGEEQLLLQALEESMRLYKEVEAPRTKNNLSNPNNQEGEPSNVQQNIPRQETSRKNVPDGQAVHQSVLDEHGFDRSAGLTWIYPTNYPIRDYQFNIVHSALFKNTLVSLPTGLGKTFIAAVVMYNFYRWYPEGKVLFLAPTKPLVAQQIDSCYNVMGIPKHDTAEMTGQMPPPQREIHWKKCRMFFLTPQSLLSDLLRSTCPVQQIRCIVVDEAHKATGNYAYCQVIQAILPFNNCFRVLALSATPGNDMGAVQQVIKNLLIEHVEVRDELSSDTAQYTNERTVDTIVVKLEGFHKYIQDMYCQILGSYMDVLLKWRLVYGSARNISKYSLMMSRNKFRSNPPQGMTQASAKQIENDFGVCIALAHGLELLSQHGLRNLFRYLKGVMEGGDGASAFFKGRLNANNKLSDLLALLSEKLGQTDLKEPGLNTTIGVTQTQSAPSVYSHPKMEKLRDVIIDHFRAYQLKEEETRVMVFCQYRDTVVEVCHLLGRLKPLVKAMSFVGQATGKMSKGFSQKQQIQIMERFRRGGYNTLVSTSIGEEGLDIGELDLIICYDAHASPIRLVQRMGRTGRKRQGRIVMLLTEGKENKKYQQSLSNRKTMNAGLVNSKEFMKFSYTSPRMVPDDLEPECYKMFVTVPKSSKNRDLKKMFMKRNNKNSKEGTSSRNYIDFEDDDIDIPDEILPETEYLHAVDRDEIKEKLLGMSSTNTHRIDFSSDLYWIMHSKEIVNVSRSSVAHDLQELLEFAARQRCEVPLTQTAGLASQVCRSDLWPSKKQKKRSLHPKIPAKRKKSEESTDTGKVATKKKQKLLTSLWSEYGETQEYFVVDDGELMPPPIAVPLRKKRKENDTLFQTVEEESIRCNTEISDCIALENAVFSESIGNAERPDEEMVDVISDRLLISEKMIKTIGELEDGKRTCCRFSKMFQESDLSSLLLEPISEKNDESVLQGILHLPDSGYFEELLSPKFWEKTEPNEYDEKNDFDIGITQLLVLSPNSSAENVLETEKSCMNFKSDLISPRSQCSEEMSYKKNMEYKEFQNEEQNKNYENRKYDSVESMSDNPIKQNNVLSNEIKDSLDTKCIVNIPHEEKIISVDRPKWNFDIMFGISSENNLSQCIDEAMLKWLGSSPIKNDLSRSAENRERDEEIVSHIPLSPILSSQNKLAAVENVPDVPLSPILSSQRRKSRLLLINSSTPKPETKMFVSKVQKTEQNASFSTNLSEKSIIQRDSCDDIFKDDSSFEDFEVLKPVKPKSLPFNKKDRRKVKGAETEKDAAMFIEKEASESLTDHRRSSDEENTSGLDDLDDSFVDDEEIPANDSVDIQAQYLQSVKSIPQIKGGFKIKRVQNVPDINVYSQAVSLEELNESYEQDSFCVDTESEDADSVGDATLDILEAVLQKKKTKRTSPTLIKKKKRKRILVASSSDEENESIKDLELKFKESTEMQIAKISNSKEKQGAILNSSVQKQSQQTSSTAGNQEFNPSMNVWGGDDFLEMINTDFAIQKKKDANSVIDLTLDNLEDVTKQKEKRKRTSLTSVKNKKRRIRFGSSDEETELIKGLELEFKDSTDIPIANISNEKEDAILNSSVQKQSEEISSTAAYKEFGISTNVWDGDDFLEIANIDLANSTLNKPIATVPGDKSDEAGSENEIICIYEKLEKPQRGSTLEGKSGCSGAKKHLNFTSHSSTKRTRVTDFFQCSGKDRKGGIEDKKGQISKCMEDFQDVRENATKSEGKMTLIASSRQVTSAPEIITALKSRHHIFVLVHPIQIAHFIVSPQVGVVRIPFKDLNRTPKTTSILDLAKNLVVLFRQVYVVMECNLSEPVQKTGWSIQCADISCRLRTSGVDVLYSDSKVATADLLANLCCREYSCGRTVTVPASVRDCTPIVQFLEALPGINTALAFDVCCHNKILSDFIKRCKSVPDIRKMVALNYETAMKVYLLLNDVL